MTRRGSLIAVAGLLLAGCFGRGLNYDAERLEKKCGLTGAGGITDEQARCVAKLAGLKEKGKKCPLQVSHVESPDGSPAIRVRESCSEIALWLDRSTGEAIAVDLGQGSTR